PHHRGVPLLHRHGHVRRRADPLPEAAADPRPRRRGGQDRRRRPARPRPAGTATARAGRAPRPAAPAEGRRPPDGLLRRQRLHGPLLRAGVASKGWSSTTTPRSGWGRPSCSAPAPWWAPTAGPSATSTGTASP